MIKIIVPLIILIASPLSAESGLLELQKITLVENPRIRAMEAEVQMMKKRIPQSDALEDPKLKLGINNLPARSFSFTGNDMTSTEIGISQMIPLGRLPYRKKIAFLEFERAAMRLKAERVAILHMLRVNYYEYHYVASSLVILEDIKKKIRLVMEREIAAAKSGTGALANVIKAEIEHAMVEEEIINLSQKRRELREQIFYLVGRKTGIGHEAFPSPEFRVVPLERVKDEIAASNPELRIALLNMEISRKEILAKEAEYAPDVDVGLSYMMRRDGRKRYFAEPMITSGGAMTVYGSDKKKRDDMISAMVTFSIPLWFWKKNIPMVDEMKKKNEAAKNLYMDRLNEINARAEILVGEISRWRALHALYRHKLIPRMELALETNLARYRTSAVEFMPVIDTVRMLLRYRKELLMAEKEYYGAFSELNALMGVEIVQ